jgi:peptide chain release factor 1
MIRKEYIEKVLARLPAIEAELAAPAVASNQRKFQALLLEHAHLKDVQARAERCLRLRREEADNRGLLDDPATDGELKELARAELERVAGDLPPAEHELLIALLPPDPAENRNIIVEIRAGTGGEEAALFAADLFRLYSKFAERKGWKIGLMDASASSLGGYKEVIFSVEGPAAYRTLRYESGGHRVQRVPKTEASGRIHTSAATVAVLPEADEVDDIEIKPEELRIDIFRSSGPGGQSVNTTDSAVRITHLPTGIVVQSQDERSQQRNREKAMRVLRARLLDKIRSEERAKMADFRRSQIGSGDRSERVRTYNFPQNRVTDHRIDLTLYTLDRVMEGELDALADALREKDLALRLEQQMASAG